MRNQLIELDWKDLQPTSSSDWSASTAQSVQARIDTIVGLGPDEQLYLDLGVQYPPAWAASVDPMVDQFGNTWTAANTDGGGVNVYWSPTVRSYVATYIQKIFTNINFRGRLWAVRVGPYVGELLYPDTQFAGTNNVSFWAFDATAQAKSPVPGWHPGQISSNGQAQTFYYWYVDNLTDTFNFFLREIRKYYAGYVAPTTAGGGIWPAAASALIANNLVDTAYQHYGTGNYWYRMFPMMGPDPKILQWCSSVGDISGSNENSANWWDWSSTKQIAWLAHQNGRSVYGENPGHNAYDTSGGADSRTTMQWISQAIHNYGYLGLMWVREADMSNPAYTSLPQYAATIAAQP